MQVRRAQAIAALVASWVALSLGACASVRTAPYDLSDPARHDLPAEKYWRLDRVSRGTPLTVTTRDGGTIRGRYEGFEREPVGEYETRYRAWSSDSSAPRPQIAIGGPVRFLGSGGWRDSGAFRGFGFAVVRYARAGDSQDRIASIRRDLTLVDSVGTPIPGDSLTRWLEAGRIPIDSQLRIADRGRTIRIALDGIAAVRAHQLPVIPKIVFGAAVIAALAVGLIYLGLFGGGVF